MSFSHIDDAAWRAQIWDRLRALYLPRFGAPVWQEAEYVPSDPDETFGSKTPTEQIASVQQLEEACFVLTFAPNGSSDARRVYATFGAAPWTGGAEVFLVSAAPFNWFGQRIGELVGTTAKPGAIVPQEFPYTSFEALLFLPVGLGSVLLPPPDGSTTERVLVQAVPITAAEAALGAKDLSALMDRLRTCCALDATDPGRPCSVMGSSGHEYWTIARLELLAESKRSLRQKIDHHERFIALDAPHCLIEDAVHSRDEKAALVRYLESRPLDLTDKGVVNALRVEMITRIFDDVLAGLRGLIPSHLVPEVTSMLSIVFSTHPRAMPLLDEAAAEPALSWKDSAQVISRMSALLATLWPGVARATLITVGTKGAASVWDNAARKRGSVDPSAAWQRAMEAMLELVGDDRTDESRQARAARFAAVASVRRGFLTESVGKTSAYERLVAAGHAVALDMVRGAQGLPPVFGGKLSGKGGDA